MDSISDLEFDGQMRKAKEMGALTISRITKRGFHSVGGVAGLMLQVQHSNARSWVLRATVGSKRRDMGLGGYPDVTLAGARDAARDARALIDKGIDPIEHRRAAKAALCAAQGKAITFKACAEAYISAHELGWKNEKHRAQWTSSLTTYAYPTIGHLAVREVSLDHVMAILQPLWKGKTVSAYRLRGRIEQIIDFATARGYRDGSNPARWRGHLDKLLAAPTKVAKVRHHAAMPLSEMGAFMKQLRAQPGTGARALEFLILTAARSGEVRGATWKEIDFDARVWTVPFERMKAGKEHRVALSGAAIKLLSALSRTDSKSLVFPSAVGGPLSDMTLLATMRRMGANAVPHGFRSTFRDWAAECTNYPRDAAEMALAHAIGDKVEAAYRRGDLFEKRKLMMADWAAFCAKDRSETVVPIARKTIAG
jgi:integrase